MNSIDLTLATLRSLPPVFQEKAIEFIHQLHAESRGQRLSALHRTSGCMTAEEADVFEKAITQDCEKIDAER